MNCTVEGAASPFEGSSGASTREESSDGEWNRWVKIVMIQIDIYLSK